MGNQKKKKVHDLDLEYSLMDRKPLHADSTGKFTSGLLFAWFQGGDEQKQKSYHWAHICSDW